MSLMSQELPHEDTKDRQRNEELSAEFLLCFLCASEF